MVGNRGIKRAKNKSLKMCVVEPNRSTLRGGIDRGSIDLFFCNIS